MPPQRIRRGGFSCLKPGVDIDVGEDDQARVAGVDFERNWHEDRDVGQDRVRQRADFDRRLDLSSLGFRVESDNVAGEGAMKGMEDLLLQGFIGSFLAPFTHIVQNTGTVFFPIFCLNRGKFYTFGQTISRRSWLTVCTQNTDPSVKIST